MDKFFQLLKSTLVGVLCLTFCTMALYTPQVPTSKVELAEAGGGLGNFATELTQIANNVLLGSNVVQNTITAGATASTWAKENVLDGLGWAIAKRILSGIVRSLINWVNSGFEGRPAFIQDVGGFLRNIADEEIGRAIEELGGVGSFICSPFRLDVQISVAMQYQRSLNQQSAPTCTLSGVIDNIQGFINGTDQSSDGFRDWFRITSTPQTYTPYGAALSAQATVRARLINARGETLQELNWGDGFLSQKICQSVSGFTGTENCQIVKPGQVIADQLNQALGAGQRSLIEADEINELIGALFGQLANQALTGVAGLLGLSGGDGFGGRSGGPSYLDRLYDDAGEQVIGGGGTDTNSTIGRTIERQFDFRDAALDIRREFTLYRGSAGLVGLAAADDIIADIDATIATINTRIIELSDLEARYNAADTDGQIEVLIEFSRLTDVSSAYANEKIAQWTAAARDLDIDL
jgi:hypothetical protein